jgi:hypothetical protein
VVNIHITVESDIVLVVVLENQRNYVNLDGGIEHDLLMVRNHFIEIREKLQFKSNFLTEIFQEPYPSFVKYSY